MRKTILNIGKVIVSTSAIGVFASLLMVKIPHLFESGVVLIFYSFLTFLLSGVIALIAKIIVSQRG